MIYKYFTSYNLLNLLVFLFLVMLVSSPDHGGAVGLVMLLSSGILIYKQKLTQMGSETKWLVAIVLALFLFFLIGAFWQPEGLENNRYGRNINSAFQWILMIPLLFIFKYKKITWETLAWGVSVAGISGLAIALYQVYYLDVVRSSGINNHPITFGQVMVVLDLIGWVLMMHAIKLKKPFIATFLLVSSLAAFYAALLSATRGAWLAYALMLSVWLVMLYQSKQLNYKYVFKGQVVIRLLAMLIIFGFVTQTSQFKHAASKTLDEVSKMTGGSYYSSAGGRLLMWQIAWESGKEYPFGGGTGNFKKIKEKITEKNNIDLSEGEINSIKRAKHAHNQYANILAENGWHTLIAFIALKLFLLFYFWRHISSHIELVKIYAAMGLLLTLSYIVFEMTQSVFNHHVTAILFIFLIYLFFAQIQYLKSNLDYTVIKSSAWIALKNYFYSNLSSKTISSLFGEDQQRAEKFSLEFDELFVDFSKNKIDSEVKNLLLELAKQQNLSSWVDKLFSGEKVNDSENRAALHTLLRTQKSDNVSHKDVGFQLQKMQKMVEQIRSGQWLGATGRKITDVVNIGVGGSDLGPLMVVNALQNTESPIQLHYISSIDGSQFANLLKKIKQETTLFIVASKSFGTIDTLANSNTVLKWLREKLLDDKVIYSQHFIGISANAEKMTEWGIPSKNQLLFWDWVGGRYSLWSCIGLSIALKIGMDGFKEFLHGANTMDEHFKNTEFANNIPVMMALINIWNINFLGITKKAILPYDARLKYLPAYLTQLVMESNGKSVNRNGKKVDYKTCPILWGEVGPNAQHAFFQLLHQGTQSVMCDFIAITDRDDFDSKGRGQKERSLKKQHDLALANCFAQSRVLMMGNEAIPDRLKSQFDSVFKNYPGDQPSNTILLESISPKTMGMLIALYEHITFVESVIWEINPFDQWGVELGKLIAEDTYKTLQGEKQGFDTSTELLLKRIKG